ncbi:MAG TPA: hypothetical protein VFR05_03915 [Terriglobia bacterium]|nr:hypothetical protein [Terriglobia bacterium]
MEFKILYVVDPTKHFYTCTGCNQAIEVQGTVLNMYTSVASTFGLERNWVPVPKESLRDTP